MQERSAGERHDRQTRRHRLTNSKRHRLKMSDHLERHRLSDHLSE